MFKGFLVHYLSCLGHPDVTVWLNNDRLSTQLSFLEYHGYKPDFNGAVFIAGCNYAEQQLGYKHYHQCLSFGQTLNDVFRHRHEFVNHNGKTKVITEAFIRNGLTETTHLYREMSHAIDLLLKHQGNF